MKKSKNTNATFHKFQNYTFCNLCEISRFTVAIFQWKYIKNPLQL